MDILWNYTISCRLNIDLDTDWCNLPMLCKYTGCDSIIIWMCCSFVSSKLLVIHPPKLWRQKKKTWFGSFDFTLPIRRRYSCLLNACALVSFKSLCNVQTLQSPPGMLSWIQLNNDQTGRLLGNQLLFIPSLFFWRPWPSFSSALIGVSHKRRGRYDKLTLLYILVLKSAKPKITFSFLYIVY